MQISIELDSQSNQSLQNQIFEAIRQQILSGVLKSGVLMLSSRALSEQLNISRNTVIFAYDRLIDEGYLYSKRTVGTFVNAHLPDRSLVLDQTLTTTVNNIKQRKDLSANRHPVAFDGRVQTLFNPHKDRLDIDFWVGRPDPESFPTNTWRQLILKNLASAGASMTEYHDPAGIIELRQTIATHIRAARGIACRPEQIIITNGIQEGMNLVARLLITPGTIAVTESPCYQGAAYVLESYGAKLHPVPVDKEGLDVNQLPQNAGVAYVTPSHQYPFGATLPLERRIRLLEWAQQTGAYIIEDDYDSDFRHQSAPLTAVAGQDQHECVIYMGTFSKSIGAALRIGYLVLPQELVSPAVTLSTLMNNGHSWLDQAVLSDFISSGSYLKHLRRIRRIYLKRRNCLVEALQQHFGEDVTLSGLEGGMHLVWHLDEALPTSQEVQAIAQKVGIGVYAPSTGAAHDYNDNECCKHAILLGYSSTTENQINEGVARLADALKIREHENIS